MSLPNLNQILNKDSKMHLGLDSLYHRSFAEERPGNSHNEFDRDLYDTKGGPQSIPN